MLYEADQCRECRSHQARAVFERIPRVTVRRHSKARSFDDVLASAMARAGRASVQEPHGGVDEEAQARQIVLPPASASMGRAR